MPRAKMESRFYMRSPGAVLEQADRLADELKMNRPDFRRFAFVMGVHAVDNLLDQLKHPARHYSPIEYSQVLVEGAKSGLALPMFGPLTPEQNARLEAILSRPEIAELLMKVQELFLANEDIFEDAPTGAENDTTT